MTLTLGSLVAAVGWSYSPDDPPPPGWERLDATSLSPAQAVLARYGDPGGGVATTVLLVPGTNEVADAIRARVPALGRTAASAAHAGSGTSGPTLLDIDTVPVEVDGYLVHRGADRHVRRLLGWHPWLGPADLIVGHSLGAASGLLASRATGKPCLAVAPFRPYKGPAPPTRSWSLVNPADAVPLYPPGDWSLPFPATWLRPSRGDLLDAHHPGTYLTQLGSLASLDVRPWLVQGTPADGPAATALPP